MGENAKEEEPPRDDEVFDFNAKARKFYFEIETDGSLGPQEVIMKVCEPYPTVQQVITVIFFRVSRNYRQNSQT